ncbi:helix-turn-helix domain-containing protein [Vallitalea pronyensis]|uniref:Helix-turn-helix domain-containing protein n=1 Tax=Vallitalea pronyensis TaxID=1348613 RepID=A0A8J8MNU3_9FIRM|nr:helix-turn-helix domain-containing protein [Vallitalea pronyensis]QUI24633.1 helix-turn-helix domain-containing protein [Vallitalea pronyensis]
MVICMAITPAPALEKGLKILEIIAKEEQVSFNQLQSLTGYNVSSLNRYLHTLRHGDYVQKNLDNKYILGLKFFSLAQKNNPWQHLKQIAKQYLVEISETFGVSLLLIVYTEDQYIVLTKHAHKDNLTMMAIGESYPYARSMVWGMPYVMHLNASLKEQIMASYHDDTKMSLHDLQRMEAQFQQEGIMVDDGYLKKNILRIGIPLYGGEEKPIAILGAGTFQQHLEGSRSALICKMIKAVDNIRSQCFKS